jgi:predicted N-acetyltransferase YhbS
MTTRAVPVVFLEGDPAHYARLGFRTGAESP